MALDRAASSVWTGIWLTVLVLAICVGAFIIALGFVPATTRYFPVGVSAVCIVIALFDIVRRVLLSKQTPAAGSAAGLPSNDQEVHSQGEFINESADAPPATILKYAAWFFGYLGVIWLISIVVASGVFVALFLRIEAGTRWWTAALAGIIVLSCVVLAGEAFHIRWPSSLLDPLGAIP